MQHYTTRKAPVSIPPKEGPIETVVRTFYYQPQGDKCTATQKQFHLLDKSHLAGD